MNTIASVSNGCSVAVRNMNKMLRFSCVNVGGRRVTVVSRGDVGIALRPSARMLSRIIIIKCNDRGGRDIIKTVSALSVGGLGIPKTSVSGILTNRLSNIITVAHSKRPNGGDTTSFCVHNMSSFGKASAPLILMSNVRHSLSLMSASSVTSFSVLGSTSTSTICNMQNTGKMVLVAAGGKRRNGPTVGMHARFNFADPAGHPGVLSSTE